MMQRACARFLCAAALPATLPTSTAAPVVHLIPLLVERGSCASAMSDASDSSPQPAPSRLFCAPADFNPTSRPTPTPHLAQFMG